MRRNRIKSTNRDSDRRRGRVQSPRRGGQGSRSALRHSTKENLWQGENGGKRHDQGKLITKGIVPRAPKFKGGKTAHCPVGAGKKI